MTTHASPPILDQWTYSVAEAAKILGGSKSGLHEAINRKEVKVLPFGRRRIPRKEMLRLLGEDVEQPMPHTDNQFQR
jgi:hypothetical protein